jgi:hypothetical protein
MNRAILIFVIAIIPMFLSACEESYTDQFKKFEARVAANRLGSSADHWVVKRNALGEWEKVALVFGFADDRRFCGEVVELYMRRYPSDRYMCLPAN